jgi:integrase/recombinase XerD
MTTLGDAMDAYLRLRRDLGFKLVQAERWLQAFIAFMEVRQAAVITTELALAWAMLPVHAQPACWAKRLMAVRLFARYQRASDPRTEVPPAGLVPYHPRRAKPYLYTQEEVARLLCAAALPPTDGLRGCTYACLLGLLAVTGLRIGEALALAGADVDLPAGLLTIRSSKFGKSRLVPLHASTVQALSAYARRRENGGGLAAAPRFFVSERGTPLRASTVRRTFRLLCRQVGLQATAGSDEPRLHHFRHRFATETLLQWYRSGEEVERQLPILSTFLGHTCIADTYWYLSACPELMEQAVARLEQRWEAAS